MSGYKLSALALLCCLLSFVDAPAQTGWHPQTSGTTQDLNSLSFVDASTGWAVGNGGSILKTTDAGLHWLPQSCGLSDALLAVSFFDLDVGMAVGQGGTIIHTLNGGNRWTVAQNGWLITFRGAQMITPSMGVAVGTNSIFQPLVSVTQDGWSTWKSVSFYLQNGSNLHEGGLTDVHFLDSSTGFASAYVWNGDGAVCRTADGGNTWSTIHWFDHAVRGIHFPSATTGFAVGDAGLIAKTDDGGVTWSLLSGGTGQDLQDLWFESEQRGIAVGSGGTIVATTDGGAHWRLQASGTSVALRAAMCPAPNVCFTAGTQGTLLYTEDGGGDPLLADTYTLSVQGGQVDFVLDAGLAQADRYYLVLGTLSGTLPGLALPGGSTILPLNWDGFTDFVVLRLNTTLFSGFLGQLDGNGSATAGIDAPAVNPSKLGKVMHFAYVLEGEPWDFASNAVAVTFVP